MSKFDRKTQQLKARVQYVRGTVRKAKGSTLNEAEADTMTDKQIEDEIALGHLEAIDIEPAEKLEDETLAESNGEAAEPETTSEPSPAETVAAQAEAAQAEAAPRRGRK